MCLVLGVSASESACGQGLRTGAHLRCFPSHRCAAGPSPFTKPRAATPSEVPVHPAFPGRGIMLRPWAAGITPVLTSALHRFASLGLKSRIDADCPFFDIFAASIRKSGLEIGNRCTDYPCFDLMAASIRKSGLEIKNRCTEVAGMYPMAAAIAKSGPEIKNRCNTIVPASITARLQQVFAATLLRPIPIFFVAKYCSSACVRPLPQS